MVAESVRAMSSLSLMAFSNPTLSSMFWSVAGKRVPRRTSPCQTFKWLQVTSLLWLASRSHLSDFVMTAPPLYTRQCLKAIDLNKWDRISYFKSYGSLPGASHQVCSLPCCLHARRLPPCSRVASRLPGCLPAPRLPHCSQVTSLLPGCLPTWLLLPSLLNPWLPHYSQVVSPLCLLPPRLLNPRWPQSQVASLQGCPLIGCLPPRLPLP